MIYTIVIIFVACLCCCFLDLCESSSIYGSRLTIKSSEVQPPLLIHLTPSEKKFSRLFRKQLEDLGITSLLTLTLPMGHHDHWNHLFGLGSMCTYCIYYDLHRCVSDICWGWICWCSLTPICLDGERGQWETERQTSCGTGANTSEWVRRGWNLSKCVREEEGRGRGRAGWFGKWSQLFQRNWMESCFCTLRYVLYHDHLISVTCHKYGSLVLWNGHPS